MITKLVCEKVEIYALIDPRDGEVRYIGKAIDSKKRLKTHLRESRRDFPVYRWIKKLKEIGLSPSVRVEAICSGDDWQNAERAAIAKARADGVRLLNVADGGDQPMVTPEQRQSNYKALASHMKNPVFMVNREMVRKLSLQIRFMDGVDSVRAQKMRRTMEKIRVLAKSNPELLAARILGNPFLSRVVGVA